MMKQRKKKTRTSMSFLTALGLSANNLRTKKGRTILTAFAGSIGIIGIALILSLSSGVNTYIQSLEEDTMAEYPIQITSSQFDFTSLLSSVSPGGGSSGSGGLVSEGEISVVKVINTMLAQISSNDLSSLKGYIEEGDSGIQNYVKAIEYQYNVDPIIYLQDGDTDRQVNPDTTMSSSGSFMTMISSASSSFYAMPENENLYRDSYEVLAGRWPENYNECVLVLSAGSSITDYMIYTLGLRDYSELETMVEQFSRGEEITEVTDIGGYTYDDVLGITYKVISSADLYAYDSEYDVWVDKSGNEAYVSDLVANGEDLTIVGVVEPTENAISASLSSGINYPMSLIYHMSDVAATSEAVQAQMDSPDINIFTGEAFGEESEFDMSAMLDIDEDAFANAFDLDDAMSDMEFDTSSFDFDTSSMEIDMSSMDFDLSGMSFDLSDMDMGSFDLSGMDIDMSQIDPSSFSMDLSGMDMSVLSSAVTIDTSSLPQLSSQVLAGYQQYLTVSNLPGDFASYLQSDAAKEVILDLTNNPDYVTVTVDQEGLTKVIEAAMAQADTSEDDTEKPDADAQAAAVTAAVQEYLEEHETLSTEELNEVIAQALADTETDTPDEQDEAAAVVTAVLDYISTNASVEFSEDGASALAQALVDGYTTSINTSFSTYLSSNTTVMMISQGLMGMLDMTGMQDAMSSYLSTAMTQMMGSYTQALTDAMQTQMTQAMSQMMASYTQTLTAAISDQMSLAMESMMSELMDQITQQLTASMEDMMTDMMSQITEQLSEAMTDAFTVDSDALSEAFAFNMDSMDLTDILTSMSSSSGTDYTSNLNALGYIDMDNPSEIDIYPTDFESKEYVVNILDAYNEEMENTDQSEKVISYTDLVATMMSSVTTIVNTVSYVLIAFVAVSLIVSCIMISVITQISVMERTKEIGILRAMGASKGNISQVFNAETFIIGACSGLIGVLITELLIIPINMIIHVLAGTNTVNAVLPWNYALILVLISIAITVLSGLIPALRAAKQDPVTALRTE